MLPPSDEPDVVAQPTAPLPKRASPIVLGAALGAFILLVLALFALVPAREPAAIETVPFSPKLAVEQGRLEPRAEGAPPVNRLSLWSFPLCARPAEGARLDRVKLAAERDSFVVWCEGGYVLVDVQADGPVPSVTRLARFTARGQRPGGAAALDLDRDGPLDLVLGVAPSTGVVHRPFSGVYWLRGRAQGGFELPRALVEMPTIALRAVELDGQPGSELAVLTRGDVAAQRPGELWLFAGGTTPTRAAVVPTALAPSALALGASQRGESELWVAALQPGSLVRLRFGRDRATWATPTRAELPLRGLLGFVDGPRDEPVRYVRDASDVYALAGAGDDLASTGGAASDPAPKLTRWLSAVRLGPAAWVEGERRLSPGLAGASEHGFAHVQPGTSAARERLLPSGVHVRDVSSLGANASSARFVLLVETEAQPAGLSLVVLPSEVRDETTEVELKTGSVTAGPTEAEVGLE